MNGGLKYIVLVAIGILIGMFVYDRFLVPEHTTEYRETIVTDTTFRHYKEKYLADSIKSISLSDSIDFYKNKHAQKLKDRNIVIVHDSVFVNEPFSAPLRRFNGQQAFLYGNTHFNALVAGELLDMEISNDFKIKQITNTVTKETKVVIQPSGIYATLGFGVNQQLSPLIGATYLKNKSMVFYSYDLRLKSHQAGIGFKVFGK